MTMATHVKDLKKEVNQGLLLAQIYEQLPDQKWERNIISISLLHTSIVINIIFSIMLKFYKLFQTVQNLLPDI